MARQPRFQYPGAVYHVMARGNGGESVFVTDADRKAFLHRLGQACESHGWKVHNITGDRNSRNPLAAR
jgi:putative transposase